MRIAILGAGAMGSVFGGLLAQAGHDVTLVDVNREHIDAVQREGLVLRSPGGAEATARLGATTDAGAIEPVELVVVLTKAYATRAAARAIAGAVGAGTDVVTVQNGLGNADALREVLPGATVVAGTTTVGAMWVRDGVVELSPITAARTSITQLGPGGDRAAAVFTAAGLPAEVRADADRVIWTKLAMAATAGPLSAVLRATVADLLARPDAMATLRAMFVEIMAVAAAEGVTLDADATWEHALATYRAVGPHVTSMAADVLAGRRTENEAMSLEIARRGRRHGVATPAHEVIGKLIAAMEPQMGER